MKFLVALLASIVPTMAIAEWGVEMSHRPVPSYVTNTYVDGTATTFHKIQTGMISLHWGDTLKGRSNFKGGYWEVRYFINVNKSILKYCIFKGSIAIDGISLTIANISNDNIDVAIIPHTLEHTTLKYKEVGDILNLETDMFAKYVENIINLK